MLTPVNGLTTVEDLEKLCAELVKQASQLHQKKAEVLNLIQEAKAENEKVTARKNLFTTTPVAKPPRKSNLQDVEPKKYQTPAQGLALNGKLHCIGWTKMETSCCVRLC